MPISVLAKIVDLLLPTFYNIRNKMRPTHSPDNEGKKKIKLSLTGKSSSPLELDIERELISLAINRSYTKQMAESGPLEPEEVLDTVANFALSFIPPPNISKELEEYWCIVVLNEDALELSEGGSQLCSAGGKLRSKVDPRSQKLYQLFIGLAGKEVRLTSLEDYRRRFTVNLDTVETIWMEGQDNRMRYSCCKTG